MSGNPSSVAAAAAAASAQSIPMLFQVQVGQRMGGRRKGREGGGARQRGGAYEETHEVVWWPSRLRLSLCAHHRFTDVQTCTSVICGRVCDLRMCKKCFHVVATFARPVCT